MTNRFPIFFLSALLVTALTGSVARAETPAVQKALENVKESLDSLITTKDEQKGDDLSLRIDTYRKVLTFAIADAKDLKVKLLALEGLDENPAASAWKKEMLAKLAEALARYDSEVAFLDKNEGSLSVVRVKSVAEAFKEWRDTEYAQTANQIKEMLIIDQQMRTLDTAGRRYEKVVEDVAKIKKAKLKGFEGLVKLLDQAGNVLTGAGKLNTEALSLFKTTYFPILDTGTSTASSTAGEATATTTEPTGPEQTTEAVGTLSIVLLESASSSATSTPVNSSSTASSSPEVPLPTLPLSIKELVRQSLVKTKETYKVFIEMSNFVRELLK